MSRPWETGDRHERWEGYLLEDGVTLRNLVGATDPKMLRDREDRRVEARALTMREHGIPATFDLDGIRDIHRHLFQDVYEWAGDIRTVTTGKAGLPFVGHDDIEEAMGQVSGILAETDNLRAVREDMYPDVMARIYNAVNTVHPFREGNGRTQREFLTALARESGHVIDWSQIKGYVNDRASIEAMKGDMSQMTGLMRGIVSKVPEAAADPRAVEGDGMAAYRAAFPTSAREAVTSTPEPGASASYRTGPEHGQEHRQAVDYGR